MPPGAEQLLDELADPACFPHGPDRVDIVQTHLSVVCLAGDLVYKLKKAVTLPFVDFAPLAARRQACRDEVRLNRRLCPDVYLGTAALRRVGGRLRFAAPADDDGGDDDEGPLDFAVVMRRLPQERMLDELVRDGAVAVDEIRGLARHVAAFHAGAERGARITATGHPRRLAGFAADNFTELEAVPDHGLPAGLLAALATSSRAGFDRLLPELEARAAEGFVIDGHGDLHARNVCMTTPPAIYDCIEFEPAFRCGDVATEVAFLVMDLRYRGAPELATAFVEEYSRVSGDRQLAALLSMPCSYRAMVRAKVAAMAAAEPELRAEDRDGARRSARDHLLLASAYALESRGPLWIVICGPPASGKSRLCSALHDSVGWPHLSTDVVRKTLAGLRPTDTARSEHYTAVFTNRTYVELLNRAAGIPDPVVLLDGNFPSIARRSRARAAAAMAGARCAVVYVDIDAATAAARARARRHEVGNVSDAGPETATALHASFEVPAGVEAAIALDGRAPTDELVARLLAELLRSS